MIVLYAKKLQEKANSWVSLSYLLIYTRRMFQPSAKYKNVNLLIGIAVLLLLLISGAFLYYFKEVGTSENMVISSYEECVAAGNPVMESYPPQCRTEDGQTFSQEIGNELDVSDEIQISNPRPNQLIEKTLEITGRAKGTWLFEAQTVARLYDKDNNLITEGIVTAQSDWMTEELIPFKGTLNFVHPGPEKGKLVIEKSNPSGLPENDSQLIVPIYFK